MGWQSFERWPCFALSSFNASAVRRMEISGELRTAAQIRGDTMKWALSRCFLLLNSGILLARCLYHGCNFVVTWGTCLFVVN